ncbi:MAG: hypothetical protein Q7S43_01260 [bacterium]|nr:hypothetical protein [bacterium]
MLFTEIVVIIVLTVMVVNSEEHPEMTINIDKRIFTKRRDAAF